MAGIALPTDTILESHSGTFGWQRLARMAGRYSLSAIGPIAVSGAHFAASLWLMRHRADLDLPRDMPDLIRRYNEAVGGVNSDTEGYHETITLAFLWCKQCLPPWEISHVPINLPPWSAVNAGKGARFQCPACRGRVDWHIHGPTWRPMTLGHRKPSTCVASPRHRVAMVASRTSSRPGSAFPRRSARVMASR